MEVRAVSPERSTIKSRDRSDSQLRALTAFARRRHRIQKGECKKVHNKIPAKYVVVWKKVGGAWKVLYDCYNMNQADE